MDENKKKTILIIKTIKDNFVSIVIVLECFNEEMCGGTSKARKVFT